MEIRYNSYVSQNTKKGVDLHKFESIQNNLAKLLTLMYKQKFCLIIKRHFWGGGSSELCMRSPPSSWPLVCSPGALWPVGSCSSGRFRPKPLSWVWMLVWRQQKDAGARSAARGEGPVRKPGGKGGESAALRIPDPPKPPTWSPKRELAHHWWCDTPTWGITK